MADTSSPSAADASGVGVENIDEIRERYAEEKQRRLEGGRYGHYVDLRDASSDLDRDPNAEAVTPREAVSEDLDVVIVGGGFSGMLAAAELRKRGAGNFRILDKAADFGGTWYWNRYPGIRCDTEAYIYLPLLEETGYVPSEKYVTGLEIFQYSQVLARTFSLYETAMFQTQVTDVTWDEKAARWRILTDRGDELRSRFVIIGSGILSVGRLPAVPGIEDFKGKMFHSSRWDFDYTGGNALGGLDKLGDKKVGVIGTGATGVQIVPAVAEWAGELYVFQRTPCLIEPRNNRPTDESWFKAQSPGWQQGRKENFDGLLSGKLQGESLIGDRWTHIWSTQPVASEEERQTLGIGELMELTDVRLMEEARHRVDEIVTDPAVAAKLKPYYGRFCKRPTYSDIYLQAFNRPSVTLVDTEGRGVDRITSTGIVAQGVEYDLDCIIFATGFEVGVRADRAGNFNLRGRDGLTLSERWSEGVETVHGIMTDGFPNMFIIAGLRQAAITINATYMFGEQAKHIAEVISTLRDRPESTFEVSPEAVEAWCQEFREKSVYDPAYTQSCTPGAFQGDGQPGVEPIFAAAYGGGPFEYVQALDEWRAAKMDADLIAR